MTRCAVLSTLLSLALLTCLALVGCNGGVVHPPPDEPNSPEYCAKRPPEENNCMACTSQPGCGWCDTPTSGPPGCQAGTEAIPSTCQAGWAQSTEECQPPPPPPPME